MKNWRVEDWCLFILTMTVPLLLLGTLIARISTGSGLEVEVASMVSDYIKMVTAGVLTLIGVLLNKNKNKTEKP